VLKFIVDYLQYLGVILCYVRECEWCARFAAVVSLPVMMFLLERRVRAITDQNVSQVETCILVDRRVTVREIANELSLTVGSVETIIHECV